MPDAYHFDSAPIVGRWVSGHTEGHREDGTPYVARWSGTYLGVVRSDHSGEPIHLFVNGEINGNPQIYHGFPAVGLSLTSTLGSTEAVLDYQRTLELHEAEDAVSLFYVEGSGGHYPPDDYLRNTGEAGSPLITDDEEAITTARCALIESEGWTYAHVFRRDPGGMHSLISSLHAVSAPPPVPPVRTILLHLNVTVPFNDPRGADQVAEHVMAALEVGLEGAQDAGVGVGEVVMALADEV